MSLSLETLSIIQKAGAAVYEADLELKNAVKEYAQRVHTAMMSNPYHLGNDTMFENWKVVARLSQTMAGIEEEIKKVYYIAAELSADDQPLVIEVPALGAPPALPVVELVVSRPDIAPTDVLVKPKKKTVTLASQPKVQSVMGGNSTKLLSHLDTVLNATGFSVVSQTAASKQTGIPLGSMTAAIKKLLESGRIIAGPSGSYKLAKLKK